jgi:hypothetical protein
MTTEDLHTRAEQWARDYAACSKRDGVLLEQALMLHRDFKAEIARLQQQNSELVAEMRKRFDSVAKNDATPPYDHHQRRKSDGKRPKDVGDGSCWLTPKEIAAVAHVWLTQHYPLTHPQTPEPPTP